MSGAAAILREEIERAGPIRFHRFMEVALYHHEHGYYRGAKDPFGKEGDFYTAEQLQPVFGILINSYIKKLCTRLGSPPGFAVVELGAGRGEMKEHLSDFHYVAVEAGDEMPSPITGVVFANEFFDALPVHVARKRQGSYRQMLVGFREDKFQWMEGPAVSDALASYCGSYLADAADGSLLEVNLDALRWLEEIAARLDEGWLLAIDYGYTSPEIVRFPAGTLMSYHRHVASEDVLADPGGRDITAHVCFTALEHHAARYGLARESFGSLGRLLLETGEDDQFERALSASTEQNRMQRTLQLKHLVFGLGETFRCLLLRKHKTVG